jgi:hypothetical protein
MNTTEFVAFFLQLFSWFNANFSSSSVAKPTTDQQQTRGNLKDELITTFKSIISETQQGLEQVWDFIDLFF